MRFVTLILCILDLSSLGSGNKTTIKLGLFIPGMGKVGGFEESRSLIPMGEVAMWQVNNSSRFLKDYDIQLDWYNTKADAGKAIQELFKFIGTKDKREYVGIVGPVFTDVTKYISELAPFFNYVSVSPTASSSALSERSSNTIDESQKNWNYIYKNSLRLHPVETDMYQAIFQLASLHCHWEKIHILTGEGQNQMSEFRNSVIEEFTYELKTKNKTLYRYSFTSSNTETIQTALDDLQRINARIIVANFDEDDAYDVFCEAYKKGFLSESSEYTGKRVWILPSSYKNNWITAAVRKKARGLDGCRKNGIIEAVGTYLTPQFQWNTTDTDRNLGTDYSFRETWTAYSQRFYSVYSKECSCSIEEKAGSLMYDSVWTLAMGLDKFLYKFDRSTGGIVETRHNSKEERAVLLDELLHRTGNRSTDLVQAMLELSFNGASGKIEFRNDRDRTCRSGLVATIQQLRVNCRNSTNLHEDCETTLVDVCEGQESLTCDMGKMWDSSIFPAKHISACSNDSTGSSCRCPVDSPISEKMDQIIIGIPLMSLLFFTVFSVLGILLSLTFFVFNVYYMKERVIKMSSPQINNLILLGAVLLYSYVPLQALMMGIDRYSMRNQGLVIKLCSVRLLHWVFCIGFTTTFGSLFAKTWRVYAIFTSKQPRHMILSDWKLMVTIGIMLSVDVILLGSNEYSNRYTWAFQAHNSTHDQDSNKLLDDTPDVYGMLVCQFDPYKTGRDAETPWFITSAFIYKGVLLVFGAFIAFQTRNISIPALNDSKYIGISIYTIVVVSAIVCPVSLFLKAQPELQFGIQAAGIIFTLTVMLCLVFLPKAYQLRYQPKEAIKNHNVVRDNWDSVAAASRRLSDQNQTLLRQNSSSKTLKHSFTNSSNNC
uniref:Metabotropic gaba receptor n=1 Tax=Bathocyroe fosteri TaxID=1566675 RepID=A0A1S6WN78_9METZ|nr:metabotropic gaba receptor [Bathocyroe fosteri]